MSVEDSVVYYRHPEGITGETELVTLSVHAVEYLADAGLRSVLQRKTGDDGAEHVHVVLAHADDSFSHERLAPKRTMFEELENV